MNDNTSSTNPAISMVLIDDEEWFVEMVGTVIRSKYKNINLKSFCDSKKAWQELALRNPDFLITGGNMGELGGEEIVRRLIERQVEYPILVVSGWTPTENWVNAFAKQKSNIRFLGKPFKAEELHAEISDLLAKGKSAPSIPNRANKHRSENECKPQCAQSEGQDRKRRVQRARG